MEHLLKSSRIKKSLQTDEESAREIDSLEQLRTEIAKLAEEFKKDEVHDQRQATLENILLRVSATIDRAEQMESDSVDEKDAEVSRMQKMCDGMQADMESMRAERLADAHVLGGVRADLAKMTAMCEAEKRARVIAENATATANETIAKQNQTILELAKQDTVEDAGWHVIPVRDAADNTMRYEIKKQ